jgi:MFS family permease
MRKAFRADNMSPIEAPLSARGPGAPGNVGTRPMRSQRNHGGGAGEALQVGAVFACLGGYFGERRGTFMGIIQAFFSLGTLLGPILGARLFTWSGAWETPLYVFGGASWWPSSVRSAAGSWAGLGASRWAGARGRVGVFSRARHNRVRPVQYRRLAGGACSALAVVRLAGQRCLFARLMSMLQLSAYPARIGAVVALGLAGFYTPGPFAGYFFGKLVEVLGWGPAAIFTVVLPAVIAASLMGFFDMRSMRSA